MMSLRKSLRRGSVWIDHSLSCRERDQMLIPPADWAVQRDQHVELLGMPKTAAEFLGPLLANLMAGVAAVEEAQRRGKVEIGADGMLHLPAIAAMADRGERTRARASRSAASAATCSSRTCSSSSMPPPTTARLF